MSLAKRKMLDLLQKLSIVLVLDRLGLKQNIQTVQKHRERQSSNGIQQMTRVSKRLMDLLKDYDQYNLKNCV